MAQRAGRPAATRTSAARLHHTDGDREWAYDTKAPSSGKLVTALDAAKQRGWTIVDLKNDWITVFPEPSN